MASKVEWTPDMIATLIKGRQERMPARILYRKIGVSRDSFYRQLRALDLPVRPCNRNHGQRS